jgi:hypothetical protein
MTPEQQKEWDQEIRSKVYKGWFVWHHRERFIPEDYKQWLGQSLPGLTPCRYFAQGRCREGEACRFLHEGQGTAEMGFNEGSGAEAEREAESGAERWAQRSGQDVRCEDVLYGLSHGMLEIGMGSIETSTEKDGAEMAELSNDEKAAEPSDSGKTAELRDGAKMAELSDDEKAAEPSDSGKTAELRD